METKMTAAIGAAVLGVAIVFMPAAPAFAADVPAPVYKARPAPVAYVWSGIYVGGHIGYGWGDFDHSSVASPAWAGGAPMPGFIAANASPKLKGSGVLGGATIGFNSQHGSIVWGVEADVTWMALKNSYQATLSNPITPAAFAEHFAAESKTDWLVTVRPRLGWTIGERIMPYVTGGLAVGEVRSTSSMIRRSLGAPMPDLVWAGSSSDVMMGWTVGGGVEFALPSRWTMKVEYLHVDLGDTTFRNADPTLPPLYHDTTVRTTLDLVRVGANYRF